MLGYRPTIYDFSSELASAAKTDSSEIGAYASRNASYGPFQFLNCTSNLVEITTTPLSRTLYLYIIIILILNDG